MTKPKLDPRPARTDLTSREVAKLLDGYLGAVVQMADIQAVKEALQWWVETPVAWEHLEATKKLFSTPETPIKPSDNLI